MAISLLHPRAALVSPLLCQLQTQFRPVNALRFDERIVLGIAELAVAETPFVVNPCQQLVGIDEIRLLRFEERRIDVVGRSRAPAGAALRVVHHQAPA
jgi:hypothetical protein